MSLQYSRGTVPVTYSLSNINDGIINQAFTTGLTSFMPILTMPQSGTGNPTVNYLTPGIIPGTPNTTTVVGETSVFLPDVIETATLTVNIPTPYSPKPIVITQPVLLDPRQENYEVHVVVPGLLVKENTNIVVPIGNISVFVEMMCGCQVSVKKATSFWTPSDFTVTARMTYTDGTKPMDANLVLDPDINGSLFIAPGPNFKNIKSVNFSAIQKSTGNYGALLVNY